MVPKPVATPATEESPLSFRLSRMACPQAILRANAGKCFLGQANEVMATSFEIRNG
jgi:hypothetical protein